MKKPLLLLLFVVVCALPGRAQDRIVLLRDTTRLGISLSELESSYPPALARKLGEKGIFARQGQLFMDSLNVVYQRFFHYIERNKRRLPVPGLMMQTQEFVRPDGSYDRVLCQFTGMDLTAQQETQLLQLVADWYGQHQFPLKTQTGFRWQNLMQLGSVPQKRTARRGPGMISTLEDARKTTRRDTVKMLAFNQLDLRNVPDIVYRFSNLEELDLSRNALNELPARLTADIPTLKRLSLRQNAIPNDSVFITPNKHLLALNLQGNKLTRIPPSIRKNRRLQSLWLGNNDLTELNTEALRGLRRLTDLNLYNAGLTTLPKRINRLKRLTVLDLYYNKIKELPRQMGRMKRLEQLAVAHNDLSSLPASLAKLRRLQMLYAHHNRISQLPDAFAKLRYLRILDLGYNWFTVPPAVLALLPALEELDLNNNNLQELPASLGTLKGLKKLYLRSNPLTRDDAKAGPYAPIIRQLEANQTEVFY